MSFDASLGHQKGGWNDAHYEGNAGPGDDWWAEQTGQATNTHSCWGCFGVYGSYLLCEAERPSCSSDSGPWMFSKQENTEIGRFVSINRPMSFTDARAYCQANFVDLASIHTSAEERMAAQVSSQWCLRLG